MLGLFGDLFYVFDLRCGEVALSFESVGVGGWIIIGNEVNLFCVVVVDVGPWK